MSSTKNEWREEANKDSEEQDVTEAGKVFQRIEQEGKKEDRWAEVEHIKGTSIDLGSQVLLATGGRRGELLFETGTRTETVDKLPEEGHLAASSPPGEGRPAKVLRRDILGSVKAEEWEWRATASERVRAVCVQKSGHV